MSGSAPDPTPDLPDSVEDALAEALLRSPAERQPRLDALLALHPEFEAVLRARIEQACGADDGRLLPANPNEVAEHGIHAGTHIDRYELIEQIAEGGMGTVWMAAQREPIRRRVALKVIKLGMDTRQVMARFAAERQALAMMDHPHIAKVFDAGSTARGRPYFVMEYIRGVPILEYCDRERVRTEVRLGLFIKVCQAIQHAHQKGIIHRDIKPSNVLVTLHDGVPVPKVIDFGIAKATDGGLTEKTLFTGHRQMLGTPAYMSPEQAEMSGLDVDTRSDVYSLGVLLYELLTGTTPFDNKDLLTKGFVEMVRTIREVEPQRPSTRISTLGESATDLAARRRTDRRGLGSLLRGELDWIVMKCLEKDRSRRYDTADGLAADIQRHLVDEPVTAGPPGAHYRLRKFVRRNRGRVIAGSIVTVTLVLGLIVSGMGWRWALDEKDRADAARLEESAARTHAELLVGFMGDMLKGIGPSIAKGRDITMLREMMDAAATRIENGELDSAPEAEVRLSETIGNIYRELAAYDAAFQMLAPALELARSTWPGDHHEVARAMNHMATLHYERGNLSAAEELYRDALAMVTRLCPGDDQRVATAQGNLAVLLQARGELAEAERLYRESLAMNRRLFAGDHRRISWSMQALATLLSVRGDLDGAEPLYRESLAMNRRLFPGDGPRVATGLGHLAILLHSRGDLDGAEIHYRESLAMNRRLFPGDHPNVATGLNALAMLLRDRGELEEATRLFVESMEMSRRLFPGDSPNRAADLDALASLYWSQAELDKAIPLFEEALAAREAKLGRRHIDTLTTMAKLGMSYREAGRFAAAIPLLEESAMASLEQPSLVLARPALLEVYAVAGELVAPGATDRAVELVRRIAAAEAAPVDRVAAVEQMSRHAGALLGLRQWGEAEPLLAECLAIRRAQDPDAWQTFRCASRHGGALLGQGRLAQAKPLLFEGYRGLEARAADIPITAGSCLRRAVERVVRFCQVAGTESELANWQQVLDATSDRNGSPAAGAGGR
ncbi:MAG: serine/threonine protein kinase [Planctomycetes bacterium]|nr:serine/threonine protein kinase [Planctomycetota bacterium]